MLADKAKGLSGNKKSRAQARLARCRLRNAASSHPRWARAGTSGELAILVHHGAGLCGQSAVHVNAIVVALTGLQPAERLLQAAPIRANAGATGTREERGKS
jgi:hypothetical protein